MLDDNTFKPFFTQPYCRKDILLLDAMWYYSVETEKRGQELISNEWTSTGVVQKVISILKEREKLLLDSVHLPFKDFVEIYKPFQASIAIVFLAEEPFFEKLRAALLNGATESEANQLLDTLNIPLEDNYFKKEELDLVKTNDLESHIKQYEWLISRYGSNNPYTLEIAEDKLKHLNKDKFLQDYEETKERISRAIARAKEIVGSEQEYLVDGMQFIVFYRTQRTDVINRVKYLYIPILTSMAERLGITYEDLLYCTENELLQDPIPNSETLEARKKGFAMAVRGEKDIVCLVGEEYESIKNNFKETYESIQEFRGTIAYKGFEKGIARIVNDKSDFGKMQMGDILVASMTTPEMMPLLKLASAFVTNEGGITCHAAIVSRELKKPCIIGTKIATKVLKDGDMVEVDANMGVVRKLG